MKPAAAAALLVVAFLTAGTMDYEDKVGMASDPALPVEVRQPVLRLQSDPIKPPRCPRLNAKSEPLLYSFASKADRGEWIHECHYGIRA